MKVLIVDDIEDSVKGIRDYCEEKEWEIEISDFEGAYKYLLEFDPDIIVLDWKYDAEDSEQGNDILNRIWSVCFRPTVIFSAIAETINIAEKTRHSNLIKIIPKGDEQPVIEFLEETEKFVPSLAAYRKDMGEALISSVNFIDLLKNEPDIEEKAIGYVLSKRTSEFFDKEFIGELSPSWVQYICPPISESLCVCDIIRKKSQETDFSSAGQPEEYRIILTPSCDMNTENGRTPKVSHALCAYCYPKELFHGKQLAETPSKKNIDSVTSKLNAGHKDALVAIPGLVNTIPYMTVDMKKLELISLTCIALNVGQENETTQYIRVSSVSSPFREQIVWAYLQTSCRPGVPDRNSELWAKEILTK